MARTTLPGWLERLLRMALWCYPPDFRRRQGDDVIQAYRDVIRTPSNGPGSQLGLVVWLLRDFLGTAVRAWLTSRPQAGRRAGQVDRPRELKRLGGGDVMEILWNEVCQSVRSLRRKPALTVVAVLTLAVGIGANTAIFSVVNAVLLRPFPYPAGEQLVWVQNRYLPSGQTGAVSAPEFWEFRQEDGALASIAAISGRAANLTGGDAPLRLRGLSVSPSYFEVLGVGPSMGRGFLPEEAQPGSTPVIVLSHGIWQSAFGADPNILDRTVELDGQSLSVVGVMPPDHRSLSEYVASGQTVSFWTPLRIDPQAFDTRMVEFHNLSVVGRLAAGRDELVAERAFVRAVHRLESLYPEIGNAGSRDVQVVPLREHIAGDARPTLMILLATVGLVLLVACANVTNLLLARSEERASEIAVRAALGASQRRVLLHVIVEGVVLSLGGGLVGLLLAFLARGMLVSLAPAGLMPFEVGLDGTVLLFSAGVTILAGLLAGLVPGLHASRGDLQRTIKGESRTGAIPTRHTLRRALVVGQISAAVVLISGALLLVRSIANLRAVDPGFDSSDLLMVQINGSRAAYPDLESVRRLYRALLSEIEAVPGVISAGVSWQTPMQSGMSDWPLLPDNVEDADWHAADPNWVSAGYIETLDMELVAGRLFEPSDLERPEGVVILSETAAERLWPGEEAIGQRVNIDFSEPVWREVVGVVRDVKARGLGSPPRAQSYFPMVDVPFGPVPSMAMTIRTSIPAEEIRAAVQGALAGLDPEIPVGSVRSMTDQVDASMAGERFLSSLLMTFALAALLLGAIGVYGSTSYMVSRRTREIGLRIALGARPGEVLRKTVLQAVVLGVIGVGIGLGVAAGSSRVLESLLFGVSRTDPVTFGTVAVVVLTSTILAALVPGRRAASVDPIRALKQE